MQNSLLTHFYWFALGMALAVLSVHSQVVAVKPRLVERVTARPGLCWLAAAVVYVGMCALLSSAPSHLWFSVSQASWQHLLSGVVALLLVLPAVFGQQVEGWPRRVLRRRWLAWFGLVSYGVYLWHSTIALTLIAHGVWSWWELLIADLALATAAAATSYYLIERPILRFKDRRSRPRSAGATEAPLAAGVRG
jgi:peptidoglycan/LPS O-acetylase OafA/YrhL